MGIQEYLKDLVDNQLKEMRYRFRIKMSEDIKNRMCSLLIRWDNESFRRTILFPTKEEALFYEPFVENEIREFVVATIRNSMLEIAASDNSNLFKMLKPLTNDRIRAITSNAINYFEQCNMEVLREEVQQMEYEDVYVNAKNKYPLAWEVLERAAVLEKEEYEYEVVKIQGIGKEDFNYKYNNSFKVVVCDGYTLEFDDDLKQILGSVISGDLDVFFVDSFKTLARNFEKVLHVLQIVLENNKIFVTSNYYISDGYIEKRRKIRRAAHNEQDMILNIQQWKSAPPRLKEILRSFTDSM